MGDMNDIARHAADAGAANVCDSENVHDSANVRSNDGVRIDDAHIVCGDCSRIRIGIVDNDPYALKVLAAMIARMDVRFEVIWTSELGAVAIRRCLSAAKRPDVLVTDMSMRDVPGTEVCRAIRVKTPQVGVVGVTSYAITSFCAEAARCGMQALVAKTDLNGMAVAIRNAAHGIATNVCEGSDRPDDDGGVSDTEIAGGGTGPARTGGIAFAGATAGVRFLDTTSAHMLLEDGSYERRGALSAKERDTLRLYAEGLTTKEIAAAYGVSEATIATFERRALAKLGARSRAHAISICVRRHEF